jgi:hypothetical protein
MPATDVGKFVALSHSEFADLSSQRLKRWDRPRASGKRVPQHQWRVRRLSGAESGVVLPGSFAARNGPQAHLPAIPVKTRVPHVVGED